MLVLLLNGTDRSPRAEKQKTECSGIGYARFRYSGKCGEARHEARSRSRHSLDTGLLIEYDTAAAIFEFEIHRSEIRQRISDCSVSLSGCKENHKTTGSRTK